MKPRLFFAVPCYRQVDVFWMTCVMQMHGALSRAGVPMHLGLKVGDSLVVRARNRLVADFLKTECTHLLFIDTDQTFGPTLALELLETGHDLVGCAVPKKAVNWGRVAQMAREGCSAEDVHALSSDVVLNHSHTAGSIDTVSECLPVDAIGTGVMLVARGVFERMRAAMGEGIRVISDFPDDAGAEYHKYFDDIICPDTRRDLSEDYTFCRRARKVGIQPYLYWKAVIGHVGSYEYRGNILSMFQPTKE